MDINKILNADYLDILFEGRNKSYGGYELRKKYKRRATIAGLIAVLAVGGVFGGTLIKFNEKKVVEALPEIKDVTLAEPPPVDPKKPPPPPPVQPPPPVKPTVKFTPPVIKKNEEVKEEDKPEPPKPEENKVVGPKSEAGSGDPNAIDPGLAPAGTGTGKPVEAGPPPDKIFTSVEQMPEFPGGQAALLKYLQNNIRYPATAREENIQGKVVLKFVVDKDGNVTNIEIARDIGGGCGKEAERVVKGMPKWKAGKQNGAPVKVYYTLPVSFKLGE
jgi:protein TonB